MTWLCFYRTISSIDAFNMLLQLFMYAAWMLRTSIRTPDRGACYGYMKRVVLMLLTREF